MKKTLIVFLLAFVLLSVAYAADQECYNQWKTDPDCVDNEEWCKTYYKLYCDTGEEPTEQEVEAEMGTEEGGSCYDRWKSDPDCVGNEDYCKAWYKLYCDSGETREPTDEEVETEMGIEEEEWEEEEILEEKEECSGCLKDSTCLPFGIRTNGKYCSTKKSLELQKQANQNCYNNYECKSNFCGSGNICVAIEEEVKETKGLLQKIINFIKGIFGISPVPEIPEEQLIPPSVPTPTPTPIPTPVPTPTPNYHRLYSDDSPWNQKIPADAEVDPNSDLMLNSLKDASEEGFIIAVKEFSISVYFADEKTPRYDILMAAEWAPKRTMLNVPIPNDARPDPGSDGHLTIIDTVNGYEYDLYVTREVNGYWKADWGNRISINSDGIYPNGYSCRGSGFTNLAGVIWPEELKNEKIEHALIFTYPYVATGGPVWPATESDEESYRADAIPEGARVQLDPNLDLDSLNLEPYEKTIAKALQEYGMIVGDAGGGIELEAINPISYTNNPYEGILPDETYVYLENIPVDKFRILKLGPQNPDYAETHAIDESLYSDDVLIPLECKTNAECPSGKLCSGGGDCVECIDDEDCPSKLPWCEYNICVEPD